jgi:hypothetical protein
MSYVLINNAPDGRHVRTFPTFQKAQAALEAFLGRAIPDCAPNRPYTCDFGNRLVIEERPNGHNAQREQRYAAAFDAREYGIATKSQLKLLDEIERS